MCDLAHSREHHLSSRGNRRLGRCLSPFDELFFSSSLSDTAATLASFATFSAGFFARPFGAVLFGHFGDRVGPDFEEAKAKGKTEGSPAPIVETLRDHPRELATAFGARVGENALFYLSPSSCSRRSSPFHEAPVDPEREGRFTRSAERTPTQVGGRR